MSEVEIETLVTRVKPNTGEKRNTPTGRRTGATGVRGLLNYAIKTHGEIRLPLTRFYYNHKCILRWAYKPPNSV